MTRWHRNRERSLEGVYNDDGAWDLVLDLNYSWEVWRLLEGIEWRHLPDKGSLLDQDEALMLDLGTISAVSFMVEQMLKDQEGDDGKQGH